MLKNVAQINNNDYSQGDINNANLRSENKRLHDENFYLRQTIDGTHIFIMLLQIYIEYI